MSTQMTRDGFGVLGVAAAILLSSCSDEACQKCDLSANGYQVCPEITKQCGFGTITAQQCSGEGGASTGCCATSPDQISCGFVADKWSGQYEVVNDVIRLEVVSGTCRMEVSIDPVANGWVNSVMNTVEKERVIGNQMARLYAMRRSL